MAERKEKKVKKPSSNAAPAPGPAVSFAPTPKKAPKEPESDTDSDAAFSDDDQDILDSMHTFFVSSEGVPVSDSLMLIAKSVLSMSSALDALASKMIKLQKAQVKELRMISDALVPPEDPEDLMADEEETAEEAAVAEEA